VETFRVTFLVKDEFYILREWGPFTMLYDGYRTDVEEETRLLVEEFIKEDLTIVIGRIEEILEE